MSMPGMDNGEAFAKYEPRTGGDPELEKAIEEIGRNRVFAEAEKSGWRRGDVPPKFVWWGLVHKLRQEHATQQRC